MICPLSAVLPDQKAGGLTSTLFKRNADCVVLALVASGVALELAVSVPSVLT
jgi:hypothetical protein